MKGALYKPDVAKGVAQGSTRAVAGVDAKDHGELGESAQGARQCSPVAAVQVAPTVAAVKQGVAGDQVVAEQIAYRALRVAGRVDDSYLLVSQRDDFTVQKQAVGGLPHAILPKEEGKGVLLAVG